MITPRFKIGDKVSARAFVDCFDKPVARVDGLIVEDVRLVEPAGTIQPIKPYYRVLARAADGFGCVEGAEHYFEGVR